MYNNNNNNNEFNIATNKRNSDTARIRRYDHSARVLSYIFIALVGLHIDVSQI